MTVWEVQGVQICDVVDIAQVDAVEVVHFVMHHSQHIAPAAGVEEDAGQAEIAQWTAVAAHQGDDLVGAESPALQAQGAEPLPLHAVEDAVQRQGERAGGREAEVDGGEVGGGEEEVMEDGGEGMDLGGEVLGSGGVEGDLEAGEARSQCGEGGCGRVEEVQGGVRADLRADEAHGRARGFEQGDG